MTQTIFDFKKSFPDLYAPKTKPALIDVGPMAFVAIDGIGSPQKEDYQKAVQALYAISYSIKMSKQSKDQLPNYFDYVVPPLEGFWWVKQGHLDNNQTKDSWLWTSIIRLPQFVNKETLTQVIEQTKKKKPEIDLSKVYYLEFSEGLCVQTMHIGPYNQEKQTLEKMREFIRENGLQDESGSQRKHHEIYLSNPNKAGTTKLRTILRLPVKNM